MGENDKQGSTTSTDSDKSKNTAYTRAPTQADESFGAEIVIEEMHSPVRGEIALWHAVITQALLDTRLKGKNNEDRHLKWQALQWLSGKDRDFDTVCEFAGLDAQEVKRKSKLAIARGCRWRVEGVRKPHPFSKKQKTIQPQEHV